MENTLYFLLLLAAVWFSVTARYGGWCMSICGHRGKVGGAHFYPDCLSSPHKVDAIPLAPGCAFTKALLRHFLLCLRVHLLMWSFVLLVSLYKVLRDLVRDHVTKGAYKSYVCQPTCPPHSQGENELYILKKATTPCTRCHSFGLGLVPASEIYRQFIIF